MTYTVCWIEEEHVMVREQIVRVGSRDWIQVLRLDSNHSYSLNHLPALPAQSFLDVVLLFHEVHSLFTCAVLIAVF